MTTTLTFANFGYFYITWACFYCCCILINLLFCSSSVKNLVLNWASLKLFVSGSSIIKLFIYVYCSSSRFPKNSRRHDPSQGKWHLFITLSCWRRYTTCWIKVCCFFSFPPDFILNQLSLASILCFVWFFTSQSTFFQLRRDRSSWIEPVLSLLQDTGEARARNVSVSSQALYHWATALPIYFMWHSETVQTKIRSLTTRRLIRVSTFCLPNAVDLKIWIKLQSNNPKAENGFVQLIRIEIRPPQHIELSDSMTQLTKPQSPVPRDLD